MSGLSVQFQETHARIPPVNQNGFSRAKIGAPGPIGRRRGLRRAGPTRRHKSLSSARQRRHPPLPEPSGTKITKWVTSTPSSSMARPRSSKASPARSALTSSKSRGPRAPRATPSALIVSPPRYFSSPFRDGSLSSDTDHCTIYVQKLEGQKLCLKVRPYDSCLALKRKILAKENIPVAQQRLVFRGRQLQDGLTLYDSNIFDGAVVFLIGPRRVPAPLPPI